jgi:hypothetical protein
MPTNPPYRESLRIGGGYGAVALGQSPAGGLDIDSAGRLATDGDITCSGDFLAAGDFAVTGRNLEWSQFLGAQDLRSGLTPLMKTFFASRVYLPCLSFPASVDTPVGASVALPASYGGGALRFTVYWCADTAPGAGNDDVQWSLTAAAFGNGDTLAVNATSLGLLDSYEGATNELLSASGTMTPTNSTNGPFLSVLLRRLGTLAADTFDQATLLLGIRIEMA